MARYLVEIIIKGTDLASSEFRKVRNEAEGANKALLVTSAANKALLVTSASVAAAGLSIATGLVVAAREGSKYADSLGDISRRTGFSISTTAALGLELEKAGEGFGSLDTVARTLTQTMQRAVAGEESARKTFDELGISVDALVAPGGGLVSVEELLPSIADGLASVESPAARAAVGVDLLGRGSLALVPILAKGREGLAAFREETERLSGGLDPEKILNAGALDDSLKDAQQAVKGFQVTIASGAGLDKYVDGLADAVSAVNRFAEEHENVTKVVLLTTAAIAGGGGMIVSVYGLADALRRLREPIKAAGGIAGVGRTLLTFTSIVTIAAGASWFLERALTAEARAAEEVEGATKSFVDTLEDEASTADDVRRAHERLEKARRDSALASGEQQFLAPTKPIAGAAESTAIPTAFTRNDRDAGKIKVQIDPDSGDTIQQSLDDITSRIEQSLGGVKIPVFIDGAEAAKAAQRAAKVAQRAIEDTPLELQIRIARGLATSAEIAAEQRRLIAVAEADMAKAQDAFNRADPGTIEDRRKRLVEATKRHADATLALIEIERVAARTAEDEAAALQSIEAAQVAIGRAKGNLDLSDEINASRSEVERMEDALITQKAAVDSAKESTGTHADAIALLHSTTKDYVTALQALADLEEQEVQRQRELITATAQRESALQRLARVEQRLRIITTVEGEDERDKQLKTLELQDAAAGVREAQLAFAVGPLDLTQQQAAIDTLAGALERLESALVNAQGAQIETASTSEGLGIALGGAASIAQGAIASIGEESVDSGALFKRAITGMISDLIRLGLQALTVRKSLAGIGAIAGFNPLGLLGLFQGGGEIKGLQSGGEFAISYESPLRLQGGGKAGRITSGMRGIDSVPAFVGKGELMVDHSTTDELKSFLSRARMSSSVDFQRAVGSGGVASRRPQSPDFGAVVSELKRIASPSVEGGSSRTVQFFYQPGYSVASSAEESRLFSHLSEGLGTFARDGIAKQAVK